MNLSQLIATKTPILTEGSIYEALRRNPEVKLHPTLAHAPLIYDDRQSEILTRLYLEYFEISNLYNLPMLAFTNTWRTNTRRLEGTEFQGKNINGDCVTFLKKIASPFPQVLIGGLVGCVGDAYKPNEALSEQEATLVHSYQAEKLAKAGVDFLFASTLPATSEATGIARALSQLGLPYILSFVIRPDGNILDGVSLSEAIAYIDGQVHPKPLFYMVNCVHPTIFSKAMDTLNSQETLDRTLGFQGNTASLSPEELDSSPELLSENSKIFGQQLFDVFNKYNLKVVSGCCGTNATHIRSLAELLSRYSVMGPVQNAPT